MPVGGFEDEDEAWVTANIAAANESFLHPISVDWEPISTAKDASTFHEDFLDTAIDDDDERWVQRTYGANAPNTTLSCASCFHTVSYQYHREQRPRKPAGSPQWVFVSKDALNCFFVSPTNPTPDSGKRRYASDGLLQKSKKLRAHNTTVQSNMSQVMTENADEPLNTTSNSLPCEVHHAATAPDELLPQDDNTLTAAKAHSSSLIECRYCSQIIGYVDAETDACVFVEVLPSAGA